MDQDPLVLVPVPPGLDGAPHNFVDMQVRSFTHAHRWRLNIPASDPFKMNKTPCEPAIIHHIIHEEYTIFNA